MIKIGRLIIIWRQYGWMQTKGTMTLHRFLWMTWAVEERPAPEPRCANCGKSLVKYPATGPNQECPK